MVSKYSQLKIFHFKDKIDSLPITVKEVKAPIHIRIKPTNQCNHNCWYCAYRVDNLQLGRDMIATDFIPKKKMMEIIDDCIAMGVNAITFSGGGEPFIYKHMLETAKKLVDSPIKFASLTNGSRLKGEVAEVFAKNAAWVRVSMDGWNDESYARYRGVKTNEFSNIIKNIKNFKGYGGDCALGVSFIIDRINYRHVYEFIRLIKSTGVDNIKLSGCVVDNDGKKNNEYHYPIYDEVKKQAIKAKEELEDGCFEIYDAYHLLEEKFYKDYTWCPYSQILPVIGADLNIYTCQDKAYNLESGLIGKITDNSFKNFWFGNKALFFKTNPKRDCRNHCVANEKNKMILDYLNVNEKHLFFV